MLILCGSLFFTCKSPEERKDVSLYAVCYFFSLLITLVSNWLISKQVDVIFKLLLTGKAKALTLTKPPLNHRKEFIHQKEFCLDSVFVLPSSQLCVLRLFGKKLYKVRQS